VCRGAGWGSRPGRWQAPAAAGAVPSARAACPLAAQGTTVRATFQQVVVEQPFKPSGGGGGVKASLRLTTTIAAAGDLVADARVVPREAVDLAGLDVALPGMPPRPPAAKVEGGQRRERRASACCLGRPNWGGGCRAAPAPARQPGCACPCTPRCAAPAAALPASRLHACRRALTGTTQRCPHRTPRTALPRPAALSDDASAPGGSCACAPPAASAVSTTRTSANLAGSDLAAICGASTYALDKASSTCTCAAGWTGAKCTTCASDAACAALTGDQQAKCSTRWGAWRWRGALQPGAVQVPVQPSAPAGR
jgi:hypothetical protein